MLDPAGWLQQAERLGKSGRTTHGCGPGGVLKVTKTPTGWRAWCFRCQELGVVERELSLAEKLAATRALQAADDSHRSATWAELLPHTNADFGSWPVGARLWLLRAGIGDRLVGSLGAAYHTDMDRVVLPVSGGRYWQARAYQPGRMPKYLSQTPRPLDLWPAFGTPQQYVILTEDILSAFKIACAGYHAVPVLGTYLPDHYILRLLSAATTVTWFDPDAGGRKAAAKYGKQLRAYGCKVVDISSRADPKLLSIEEIRSYVPSLQQP